MKQGDENTISLNVPIHQLQPGKYQPRKFFDENALYALANTIKEKGIIQPIVVRTLRPLSNNLSFQKYEIIAGERRWRAAQIAKIDSVPCLVKNYSDEQVAQIALIENTHREALNPIEEANAIFNIVEHTSCTHEEAAISLGISREQVTNLLRLLDLVNPVQEMLIKKELDYSKGKILAGVDKSLQHQLALKCIKNQWSKRALEKVVQEMKQRKIPTKKDSNITSLERKLSDHLGTPVILSNAGSIIIKYANYEIMEGILQKMGFKETI